MSRAELERFQTGATALLSSLKDVGEANGVCLCVRVCFCSYCIILSTWEPVLICCFLLRLKEGNCSDKCSLLKSLVCVCVCVLIEDTWIVG